MDDLLDLMEKDARGRTWLASLGFGLLEGHCGAAERSAVVALARRHFLAGVADGYDSDAELAWRSVALAVAVMPVRAGSVAPAVAAAATNPTLTHVTTIHAMEQHHVEGLTSAIAGTFAWSSGTDSSTRLSILRELLSSLLREDKLRPMAGATFGLQRMWVSQDPLNEPPSDATLDIASHHRDVRGLIHYTASDFLVAYELDRGSLPPVVRPSATDGVGTRFRAWSDQAGVDETWGMTVDLLKLANGGPIIDGVSEAIVPSVSFETRMVLNVRALGHPGNGRGNVIERGLATDVDDDLAFDRRIQEEAAARSIDIALVLDGMREKNE